MGKIVSQTRQFPWRFDYDCVVQRSGSPEVTYRDQNVFPRTQKTTSFRGRSDEPAQNVKDLIEANSKQKRVSLGDTGNEFFTENQFVNAYPGFVNYKGSNDLARLEFHGTPIVRPQDYVGSSWFPVIPDFTDVNYYGAQAISNTIPTKSAASLTQALAELMVDLPKAPILAASSMVKGFSGRNPVRGAAGDYIGIQFGIMPTVRDVQKICKAIFTASEIVNQFVRDSGLVVRRKYFFDRQTQTEEKRGVKVYLDGYPNYEHNFRAAVRDLGGDLTEYVRSDATLISYVTREISFKGAYLYDLGLSEDILGKLQTAEKLANKLLGTRLTVSTLYELAPWSWLADWFGNIGTVISNASAFRNDGLVLKYGYLMVNTRAEHIYSVSGVGLPDSPKLLRTSYVTHRKERFRSTPYGFGVNPESLSGDQWAILASLGLTKAPKKLWKL